MYGQNITAKSNAVVPEGIAQDFSKRYKYISRLLNERWNKFEKVYRKKIFKKYVRDIVLFKGGENVPRTQWHIGKINKLVRKGCPIEKDDQVRGAELAVISKTWEKIVCQRPMQKLIPFEITTDKHELSNNEPLSVRKGEDGTHILSSRRPTRKGKEEGQYLRVTR